MCCLARAAEAPVVGDRHPCRGMHGDPCWAATTGTADVRRAGTCMRQPPQPGTRRRAALPPERQMLFQVGRQPGMRRCKG
jgi:hypothetical protein